MKRFDHPAPIWLIVAILAACAFAYSVLSPGPHGAGMPSVYFAQ